MTTAAEPRIVLPTKKTVKENKWIDQKFLMLGPGGIGKSEFWAQGERTLFLECEPGLGHLEVLKVSCRSWEDIRDAYAQLYLAAQTPATFPYDTIVIDTIDRFAAMGTEEVICRAKEKYKKDIADAINSLGDIPNGAGWYWQTELIGNAIKKFEGLPAATVLIGHLKKETIEEPTRKIPYTTISIGGQTGTNLLYWSDHTLHLQSRMVGEDVRRKVRTKPTENIEAKSKGGIVADGMEWGKDARENYAAFRKLFN